MRYWQSVMSEQLTRSGDGAAPEAISFQDKFAVSPQFKALFEEGMQLVERTAYYLDGQGRIESKELTPPASLLYTTESMRLTTRLMQVASWLLLRRAVAQGEITDEQARHHKRRVHLMPQSRDLGEGYEDLPVAFRQLVEESHRLYERILRLEQLAVERPRPAVESGTPVGQQIARLRLAFSAA